MQAEKLIKRLIPVSLALSFITLLLYGALGFQIRMVADDYCSAALGRDYGAIDATIFRYQTWSASYTNSFIKYFLSPFQPAVHPWIGLLTLILMFATIAYVSYFILAYLNLPERNKLLIPLTILVTFTFYRMMPSYQHAFWYAAVIRYTWPVIGALFYTGTVLAYFRKPRSPLMLILFLLWTIVILLILGGFMSTMITLAGVIFAILLLSTGFLTLLKRFDYRLLFIVGGLSALMGLLIVIASPGVELRREAVAALSGSSTLSPLEALRPGLLFTVTYFFGEFFGITFGQTYGIAYLVNMGALVLIGGLFFLEQHPDYHLPDPPSLLRAFFISLIVTLLTGFSVIYPSVYASSGTLPMRPLLHTRMIQIIVFGYWFYLILVAAQRYHLLARLRRAKTWTPVLIVISFLLLWSPLISIYKLLNLYPDYQAYAQSWDERHELLSNAEPDSVIIIPPLAYDIEDSFVVEKPEAAPTFWINGCIAKFYELEIVALESVDDE